MNKHLNSGFIFQEPTTSESKKCKCQSNCKTKRCACKKNGAFCDDQCGCGECDNRAVHSTSGYNVSRSFGKWIISIVQCNPSQGFFQQFWEKASGQNWETMINLTSKLGEINNIVHKKGSKIYPQNQVILDCIMPSIPLKHKCISIILIQIIVSHK